MGVGLATSATHRNTHFVLVLCRLSSNYLQHSNRLWEFVTSRNYSSGHRNYKEKCEDTSTQTLMHCTRFTNCQQPDSLSPFPPSYFQDPAKPIRPSIITDACLVVDVLGADVRSHLIERYVSLELKEYRRIFRATDEAGQLDNLSRRFAWFRRLQQNHEAEAGRVFPQEWNVAWSLLAKFSEVTRDDVTGLLAKANVGGGLTVAALFQALQTTLEFEVTMAKKFNMPVSVPDMGVATSINLDGMKFQEILNSGALSDTAQPPKSISAAFESHLSVFVDAQDKYVYNFVILFGG